MVKLPEQTLRDQNEMRAFYESAGLSQKTIERAIRLQNAPEETIGEAKTSRSVEVKVRRRKRPPQMGR